MFYSGLTELAARHDWCPITSAWQSTEDVGGRLVGPRPKGVMGSAWARDVPVRRRGRKPGDEEPERRGNASVLSRGFLRGNMSAQGRVPQQTGCGGQSKLAGGLVARNRNAANLSSWRHPALTIRHCRSGLLMLGEKLRVWGRQNFRKSGKSSIVTKERQELDTLYFQGLCSAPLFSPARCPCLLLDSPLKQPALRQCKGGFAASGPTTPAIIELDVQLRWRTGKTEPMSLLGTQPSRHLVCQVIWEGAASCVKEAAGTRPTQGSQDLAILLSIANLIQRDLLDRKARLQSHSPVQPSGDGERGMEAE